MNISICITVFNEERSVGSLLDSLITQSRTFDEIVIVDGGSIDKTVEIINHYQKKNHGIKLLKEKCSRARGRNLSVEMARSEIIAMTDAGCTAHKNWLKNLCTPLGNPRIDVSAGFYTMTGSDPVQKAMTVFLGTSPNNFDAGFLPSTRSIAFKKSVWEKVGGFPENLDGAAEDTVFNYKLLKANVRLARTKSAIVEWGMPETINNFKLKMYNYAKGDAKSKIWLFPKKGPASHNIKAIFILLRYFIGFSLLVLSFTFGTPPFAYLLILLFAYCVWAYRKAGFWGIVLQFVSDFGVISGFLNGILRK